MRRPVAVRVLLTSFAAAAALLLVADDLVFPSARPSCREPIPTGSSKHAAERVVELFLRTTLVARKPAAVRAASRPVDPACGAEVVSPALAGSTLPSYATRYPDRITAWYQLARRIVNARGRWEYTGFLYLGAPDAPPSAFEFLIELRGNRWLISSFVLVDDDVELRFPT